MLLKQTSVFNMKLRFFIRLFVFGAFSVPYISSGQETLDCESIINKMITAIDKIETLRYTLNINERIDGRMISGKQDVKLVVNPFKVYVYSQIPNEGAEVLWVSGKNGGDALVNPAAFPYINLNLDPYGSIMRKDQHHTLHKSGFNYLKKIIEFAIDTAGADFDNYFLFKGIATVGNRDCYKVVIEYDSFNYLNYTVRKGQTILDIAQERLLSEYMIVSVNPDVDDYDDISEGQIIKIPVVYIKKSVLHIDKINYLPIKQEMYDEKGLFEKYEFSNLKINSIILEEEFTEGYKDYNY